MQRYPPTGNRSLSLRSAADDLLIDWAAEQAAPGTSATVLHDRFGVVSLSLAGEACFVPTFHSQLRALELNAAGRAVAVGSLLEAALAFDFALVRIPKSLELFEVYLRYLSRAARPGSRIACAFMTRHFTQRLLKIAHRYAGKVEQTRARRKARLLLLEDLTDGGATDLVPAALPLSNVEYAGTVYRQYPGVFSSGRIDSATRYLIEHWGRVDDLLPEPPRHLLDIGCGNGVIGHQLLLRYPNARLTAFDDHILAVASGRLNLSTARSSVHWGHRIRDTGVATVDLAVTNPPFHFGHEGNIEISISLFREAATVLAPGGTLVGVANRHLNYATHLSGMFRVMEVWSNGKFVIYACRKSVGGED